MTEVSTKKQRNLLLALLFLGWSIGNFDRYVINYAIVFMGEDLGLSATATGLVLSSFFLGYAIMQIPGGMLADRFNPRFVMIATIFTLSLFTTMTAVAWSVTSLIIIRFLFGLGEGSFFPTASKFITVSFPEQERSKALSVVLSSAGIMSIITALAAGVLLESFGWRILFVCAGVVGLLLAFIYLKLLKIAPVTPSASAAKTASPKQKVPMKRLLKNPLLWKLFSAYFMLYFVNWGLSSWMPTYLKTVRELDMATIGVLHIIPGIATIIGIYISGFLQDRLKVEQSKWTAIGFILVSAVLLFLMYGAPSVALFFTYQTLIALLLTFVFVLMPSIVLKKAAPEDAGFVAGFVNTGGQLAGFVAPTAIGIVIDQSNGSYMTTFALMAGCAVLGAVAFGTMSFKNSDASRGPSEIEHEVMT
ncbi:sugar phosphate permease [Paenibacillus phyllosphaerae]|uniref:Sugar phosphate permease n=1 Tax=Paenibacillus phyllosphaerae TaxID=274593 RepID=A0A7W5AZ35_9BACL|nr:MFS transporter [Paenibacillus phyllosphaerae]MBB3111410.1 sugar phosphate permease [Paenibacillus phyllosphaerae]